MGQQRISLCSPERQALITELWGSMTPTLEVLALVNAAPGPEGRVTVDQLHRWGTRCGKHRPSNLSKAQRRDTFRQNYTRAEAPSSAEREPILRSLATLEWPYERMEKLAECWNSGMLTAEIGERLRCNRNAVLGKTRRLVEAGAVLGRLSPVVFQEPPPGGDTVIQPRPAAARPVSLSNPKVTLAPLASLADTDALEVDDWMPLTVGRHRSCQFVTREHPYELCGEQLAEGSRSWCETHRLLVIDVAATKRTSRQDRRMEA